MEGLVYGISAISFDRSELPNENCAPNYLVPTSMANEGVIDFNDLSPVSISPFEVLANRVNNEAQLTLEPATEERRDCDNASDNLINSTETIKLAEGKCRTPPWFGRRLLPLRTTKHSGFIDKTTRSSIMKQTQRLTKACRESSLDTKAIKKMYLPQKLTKFHPSKLETIFEEPQADPRKPENPVLFTGARKLKRSLSLGDGFNINKTLAKQRRHRIKQIFGRRFALKKIPLDDFLHRLKNSPDEDEEGKQPDEEEKQPGEEEKQPDEEEKQPDEKRRKTEIKEVKSNDVMETEEI